MSYKPLPTPLYQRIFVILYQRIRDGSYSIGQHLPTEEELATEFGVSKATIRQAVGELVARDIVVRRQGRGTFVKEEAELEPKHRFVGSFTDLILGTKALHLRNVHLERDVTFPPRVRRALQTEKTTGTVIRRSRDIDGEVFAYQIQYVSPAFDKHVTAEKVKRYGLPTLLYREGVIPTTAEQSISAELADIEVARRLEIDLSAPVLYAERVLRSEEQPIEVVSGWYRGDLYQWRTLLEFNWIDDEMIISPVQDSSPRG